MRTTTAVEMSRDRLHQEIVSLARSLRGVGCVEVANGEGLELAVDAGEAVRVRVVDGVVTVELAGWSETIGTLDGGADDTEVEELTLDLLAAWLFGEVRVIEEVVGGKSRRQALEVRVGGAWRLHARSGGLGLGGLWARVRGTSVETIRANDGTLRRRGRTGGAAPSGHPSAPWAGAAGSTGVDAAPITIDGELDLHNFSPKQVKPLVLEYIEVCRGRGILELRIIHGKGKGVLRRTVHSLLERHPAVQDFRLGGHGEGSWGATMVTLYPASTEPAKPGS